ncbi:MAG: class I SAM-dependent methyltransferase [Caldilineaceae bacterium]
MRKARAALAPAAHHPRRSPRRPQGEPTRGKTARNRLRRADTFLSIYAPALFHRHNAAWAHAYFVDLGYGAEPITTLESAQRLRKLNPQLPVLGVEIDPERVAVAQPYADAITHFRLGGFNLPLQTAPSGAPEKARAIRAFNVLRQYEESAVPAAYRQMCRTLMPGGLLLEGTSDPFGRIWVANLARQCNDAADGYRMEALVFSLNFRASFDPAAFQALLPKNLIHRMTPGALIYDFLQAWKQAALETAATQVWGARHWFMASAQKIAEAGYAINVQKKWLSRGYLIWRIEGLVD